MANQREALERAAKELVASAQNRHDYLTHEKEAMLRLLSSDDYRYLKLRAREIIKKWQSEPGDDKWDEYSTMNWLFNALFSYVEASEKRQVPTVQEILNGRLVINGRREHNDSTSSGGSPSDV